jgi:ferric-dicitrate binding protein FerR (iron transport regulator)
MWVAESEENRSLFEELTNETSLTAKLKVYAEVNTEALWEKTVQQIDPAAKVVPLYPAQRAWWKYATAAAVVLGVSLAGWQYFKPVANQPVVEKQPVGGSTDDIVPGSSKATLTLIDGKKVELTNVADQKKIEQGNITISRTNGRLSYSGVSGSSGQDPIAGSTVLYNTVSTPKGGQYQVILPDGSIVWLNAASSLRFPIAFAGNERNVLLTGEAFFEVAHMPNKPFKVAIQSPLGDGGIVEVLGTQFDINAYADDALVKTTLVEGSVKLTTNAAVQQMLKPGQQAAVDKGGKVEKVSRVDITSAVPWKNGEINLATDVKLLMQEIGRWYNLDIEYAGKIPVKSLKGQISRDRSITDVLGILKKYGIETTLNKKDKKLVVI